MSVSKRRLTRMRNAQRPDLLLCITHNGEARVRIYIDRNDWWVGYYRGDTHHYVCPLPTVVIRWKRRLA